MNNVFEPTTAKQKEILVRLLENEDHPLIYNSELEELKIPEYGRVIHQMVKLLKEIENKEERNAYAREIIRVMGRKNPHLRDVPDFQHKLWDHLFIMADFDLDVDSPFEKPSPDKIKFKPEKLPYPHYGYKYRYYGHIIHKLIDLAIQWEEGELKDRLIRTIANHMKKNYLNWNRDNVDDEIIFKHLYELSGGKIDLNKETTELLDKSKLVRKRKNYTNKRYKNHHK